MRRKRPKVAWLPIAAPITLIGQTRLNEAGMDTSGPAGNLITTFHELVLDQPASAGTDLQTLADFEGSAYRLRRIVGKIWIHVDRGVTDTAPTRFWCTAGIIVLRVDGGGTPIAGVANANQYSPALVEAERDPWIWLRSWLIKNDEGDPNTVPDPFPGTLTNYAHGPSVMDGPHIDAKTARVVSDEERLMLVLSVVALNGDAQQSRGVNWLWEMRALASMRTTSGNRRNASR